LEDRAIIARITAWILAASIVGAASPLAAQGAEPAPAAGAKFGVAYTSDLLANTNGGLKRGKALLGKLDATAKLNGGAFGIAGAHAFLHLQFVHGRSFSRKLVGDAQTVSNIEAVSALRPLEAWIDVPVVGDRAYLKFGLVDLNSMFDVQTVGALFLNSSFGIGADFSQSGLNGPSIFPTTSGALVLTAEIERGAARLGLFDAVAGIPDRPRRTRLGFPGRKGLLAVAEVEHRLGEHHAAKAGIWIYSTRFDALPDAGPDGEPRQLRRNKGGYATLEGRIARGNDGPLDGWIRIGFAEPSINEISTALGGGAVWSLAGGQLGLAASHVRLGGRAKRAGAAEGESRTAAETAIELTYNLPVTPNFAVQPDLQYVINPGFRSQIGDALVAGIRIRFDFP
jgi:porin